MKILRVAYIIAIVVIITFLLIKKFARHEIYASYSFNGKVQSVKYLDKGAAEVTIQRKIFLLDFDVRRQIEQGDSLYKRKSDTEFILIKRKTGKAIRFNHF